MPTNVRNRLNEVRRSRGIGAADLARRAGVSRQTIYAIEAGTYVPNTEVTLRLARELETSVEDLFALADEKAGANAVLRTEVLSVTPVQSGQAVRVCRMGERLLSIPVTASPYYLPEADGIISRTRSHQAELTVLAGSESFANRLIVAGCDPAIGLLTRMAERAAGIEIVSAAAPSRQALDWLKAGKVHMAGSHLRDPQSGDFNLPILRRDYPREDFAVVTFAGWEEGFVTLTGNPKQIRTVEDLARRGIRFINRETGSGSRALLDSLLKRADLPASKVAGYDTVANGHLTAAWAVKAGEADCCLATGSAARTFGLHFLPVQSERYDFVLRRKSMELLAVQAFLDILQKAALRRMLEVLAGYDTTHTGVVIA